MRRYLHRALAVWFAIVIGMAQACMQPPQNPYSSTGKLSPPVSDVGHAGSNAHYPSVAGSAGSTEGHVDTTGYRLDQSESKALTDYLTQHKLPLVGGQVLDGPGGKRAVVLYGFVGSDFGHSDAVKKARRYLGDQSIAVDNRIKVRPELLASSNPPAASPDSGAGTSNDSLPPGAQSYVDAQNQAQALSGAGPQYQGQGLSTSSMLPMILMLGILSMAASSNSFSIGPGSSGPPYSPYNSYPGYPPPYSGSPYGGSPYGPSYSPYGPSFGPSP